jgi:hypothetical protein
LIRDLPFAIASQMLLPTLPEILAKQKGTGLWQNSTQVTYDILSALKHVQVLDDLVTNQKLKNLAEQIRDKHDYYALLIKSDIFQQTSEDDINEIKKLVQIIKSTQNENGSWSSTIVATVYHVEKLIKLGVSHEDTSVQKAVAFLFKQLKLNWEGFQGSGKAYGLQTHYVFSNENRDLEFEAAKKYEEQKDPKLICYRHLGIMQNSLCLKLLLQQGFEQDKRVESALDNIYSIYKSYNSLCYFKIQKKFIAKEEKNR